MNRAVVFIDFTSGHCEHPPIPGVPWSFYPGAIVHDGIVYLYSGTVGETAFYYRKTQ